MLLARLSGLLGIATSETTLCAGIGDPTTGADALRCVGSVTGGFALTVPNPVGGTGGGDVAVAVAVAVDVGEITDAIDPYLELEPSRTRSGVEVRSGMLSWIALMALRMKSARDMCLLRSAMWRSVLSMSIAPVTVWTTPAEPNTVVGLHSKYRAEKPSMMRSISWDSALRWSLEHRSLRRQRGLKVPKGSGSPESLDEVLTLHVKVLHVVPERDAVHRATTRQLRIWCDDSRSTEEHGDLVARDMLKVLLQKLARQLATLLLVVFSLGFIDVGNGFVLRGCGRL